MNANNDELKLLRYFFAVFQLNGVLYSKKEANEMLTHDVWQWWKISSKRFNCVDPSQLSDDKSIL